ncbi:MAG: N-acetylglucosamine kinase [Candidatus Caldatribacteriaceae bacterium]
MEYFLGVDAGGSKTIGILVSNRGELVAAGISGPASIVENGEEVARASMRSLRALLEGLHPSDTLHSAFGMPAFGESCKADARYYEIIAEELGVQPKILVNDVVVGWAAGTLGHDGVHIVAGTGTIAYGRHGHKELRTSGWGSIIGDEGSAYDIGRETLRQTSRQLDGRESPTLLRELVFERLKLTTWQELAEWIYAQKESERRTTIASIATITAEAARKGDPVARNILEHAAEELSLCVRTLVRELSLSRPLVTFSGSVLEKNEIVQRHFVNSLHHSIPHTVVRKAELHPALGAVILLYREVYQALPQEFLENLKETSRKFWEKVSSPA